MTSYPNHIVGDEKLGSRSIQDPASLHFGKTPIPLLMVAQMECIHYTKFLRPLSKRVLDSLQSLVLSSKRRQAAWFTIYLTLFVLLHACALVTRRDAETAAQYGVKVGFFFFQSPERFVSNTLLFRTHMRIRKVSRRIKLGRRQCWHIGTTSAKDSNLSGWHGPLMG